MTVQVDDLCYEIVDGMKKRSLLDHVSYIFEKGKIAVIKGPSGAGKSTFLYAIAGLLPQIGAGNVRILNTDIYALSEKKRDSFRLNHISIIFQGLNLFPFMNVKQNICVPLYAKDKKVTAEIEERISYYLDLLELGQIQKKDLNSLSGGEQQRVAIIRSVIDCPEVILCDEPTASLDNTNSVLFLEQLRKIVDEIGITSIMVSHDEIVTDYSDISLKMVDGKLV